MPVPGGGLDESELGHETAKPVRGPADSRPRYRALGQLTGPVEVACVFLDQDAGHILLEAGRRPGTGTVCLIQGSLGIPHPRAADEDKNQADVQVGQVAIPASIDCRLDAVPYVLLRCFIVPGCKEAVSPSDLGCGQVRRRTGG